MAGVMSFVSKFEDVYANGYCIVFTDIVKDVQHFRYRGAEQRTLQRGMIPTYDWNGKFPVAKWEAVLMAADRGVTA